MPLPLLVKIERDYERNYQETLPSGTVDASGTANRKAAGGCKPCYDGRGDKKRERSF